MGSKQTTLIISNQTSYDIVKIETTIENNEHWDGSDNPENNFNTHKDSTVRIPKGEVLTRREELNSPIFSPIQDGAYNMTLHFSNGESVSFRNCQKDAVVGYTRNDYWLKDGSSNNFSIFQTAGMDMNKFEIRRKRNSGNHNWMSEVDGNRSLMNMSIPGSHDSGCYTGSEVDWVRTQVSNIPEQLKSGIRYFDLRGYADGQFSKYGIDFEWISIDFDGNRNCQVCHDVFRQVYTFKWFFMDVIAFLNENPTETVLVQIKKDKGDKNLEDIVTNLISDLGGNKKFYEGKDIPSLDTVRGRIVLVNREGSKLGFDMSDWSDLKETSRYAIQDKYNPDANFTESRVTKKLEFVADFHSKYAYKKDLFRLNFISLASSKNFGWRTALSYAKSVNYDFLHYLRTAPSGYQSVYLLDGINNTDEAKDLVNLIINNNY